MMAFVIRELPSDLITLKLGINLCAGDLTHRTFLPAILGFVRTIRDKKPEVPIVLISPVCSPPREEQSSAEGHICLRDMRAYVSEAVEILRSYGDRNIQYADGLKIFGPDELKYMPDELHPNAEGQPVFAEKFSNEVLRRPGLLQ
jgi:lysophospholipase L1-like esterase